MVTLSVSVVTAFFADRFGQRGLNIIFFATIAMIGFSIFYGESLPLHSRQNMLLTPMP